MMEGPVEALCRELFEELGMQVDTLAPRYIGRFETPAANEPGWLVHAEIYALEATDLVVPAAEIAEIA